MSEENTSVTLTRVAGIALVGVAVVLLVLSRTTDLQVPYGYDGGGGLGSTVGTLVAVLIVGYAGLQVAARLVRSRE